MIGRPSLRRRELLELLYDARYRYQSLHCRLSFELHRHRPVVQFGSRALKPFLFSDDGPSFSVWTSRSEVWLGRSWRMRVEQHNELDGKVYPAAVAFREGDRFWATGLDGRDGINEVVGVTFGFEFMLDPARLLASFDIEPTTETKWQARNAIQARATRRPGTRGVGPAISRHANDEYELVIDAVYGVVLEASQTVDDVRAAHYSVNAIEFDEPLDESLFVSPSDHLDSRTSAESLPL